MLLTTIEEIRACLPTSTVENPTALLTMTEDAEQNYLQPVLGDELYDYLQSAYEDALNVNDSIVDGFIPRESVTPDIELIRLCQKPIIYFALANNVGLLSVSVNEGGGMNVMEADGFSAADEKRLERFSKDAYNNAYRGVDRLLLYLERDARKESPEFADKWKKSEYFYFHGDLLFSTADQLKRYMNTCRGRQDYIGMIPDIRYCQSAYIAPELGDNLLDAFIKSSVDSTIVPKEPVGSEEVWLRAIDKLRMALGIFVMNRRGDKRDKSTEGEASLAMNQALSYIRNHAENFGEVFKKSPLYDAPSDSVAAAHSSQDSARAIFDPDDPHHTISTIFGFGVNRH